MGGAFSAFPSNSRSNRAERKTHQLTSRKAVGDFPPDYNDTAQFTFLNDNNNRLSSVQHTIDAIDISESDTDSFKSAIAYKEENEVVKSDIDTKELRKGMKSEKECQSGSDQREIACEFVENKLFVWGQAGSGEQDLETALIELQIKDDEEEAKRRTKFPDQSSFQSFDSNLYYQGISSEGHLPNGRAHSKRIRIKMLRRSFKRKFVIWRWYEYHPNSTARVVRMFQRHARKEGDNIVFVF